MKHVLLILICLVSLNTLSQEDEQVLVKGKVVDTLSYRPFYNLMIVNKSTGIGHFGSSTGKFILSMKRTDTVLISTTGYGTLSFTLSDRVYKSEYDLTFYLAPWSLELAEAKIRPLKTSEQLRKEREELEREDLNKVKGVEAFSSPITALYEFFSKKSRSKSLVAEMEFQDKKAEVLKELFRLYVSHDVIDLSTSEFDQFVNYINVSDEFFRTASEYDMILYIKERYQLFLNKNDYFVDPKSNKKRN